MFETIPPPLRFAKLWLTIGWMLIGCVIYESLTPEPPSFDNVPYWDKWGHLFSYGFLMLWFAQIYQRRSQRIWVALGLIGLGVGLEFAQEQTGYRTFEYADMLADALGTALGWGVATTALGAALGSIERRLLMR